MVATTCWCSTLESLPSLWSPRCCCSSRTVVWAVGVVAGGVMPLAGVDNDAIAWVAPNGAWDADENRRRATEA